MLYPFFFIFGTIIGSFLNVLIDRLPNEESINGRSHCDFCKKTIAPYDLIPVLSFILLKGRCRYCKKKLSIQYPLIELLTGLIFVLIFNFQFLIFNKNFEFQILNLMQLSIFFAIASCFIVIFFADVKYQIIPDEVQISLFILVLFQKIIEGGTVMQFGSNLFASIVVASPILFLYLITKGKGMGFGDVKLSLIIGFLLGIKGGLSALYIAFIIGACVGICFLLLKKKKMKSKIAFGPFIVSGVVILILFQQQVFSLVQKIYGI